MGAFKGQPDVIGHFDTIVQYDDLLGVRRDWWAGPGMVVGEAVFAPDHDGTAEDDGWLLNFVFDRSSGTTDLVILDAEHVQDGPIARVKLPVQCSPQVHGWWVPGDYFPKPKA